MSDFPCTQCGLCCRHIGVTLEYGGFFQNQTVRNAILEFPYKADNNGVCEMLVDNKCSVYNNRPILCDVELMASLLGVAKDEWYRSNAQACNFMIKQAGLDESYLIKTYDQEQ